MFVFKTFLKLSNSNKLKVIVTMYAYNSMCSFKIFKFGTTLTDINTELFYS